MQRYIVNIDQVQNQQIILRGEDAHHIRNVMRNRVDDIIVCVVEGQKTAKCKIREITPEEIFVEIEEELDEDRELPVRVIIAQGIPKGEKLEWVLQKGTELGMDHYIPLKTERTIVKLDPKKEEKKLERWGKIMKEATEQSYRNFVPTVSNSKTLKQLVQDTSHIKHKLVAYEEEAKVEQKTSVLIEELRNVNIGEEILLVVGPEGGLSKEEVDMLIQNEFKACALGPRILRTETAPLYFLSVISSELELKR